MIQVVPSVVLEIAQVAGSISGSVVPLAMFEGRRGLPGMAVHRRQIKDIDISLRRLLYSGSSHRKLSTNLPSFTAKAFPSLLQISPFEKNTLLSNWKIFYILMKRNSSGWEWEACNWFYLAAVIINIDTELIWALSRLTSFRLKPFWGKVQRKHRIKVLPNGTFSHLKQALRKKREIGCLMELRKQRIKVLPNGMFSHLKQALRKREIGWNLMVQVWRIEYMHKLGIQPPHHLLI